MSASSSPVCSIFLLSQDRDQIFLTFPHFEKTYSENQKRTVGLEMTDFLRLREYGPFKLTSRKDVEYIAKFLHAYTLRVSER